MSEKTVAVGDIVRYREVVDEGDDEFRFEVVEHNGDRVRIRMLDWHYGKLVPETVVPTRDVVNVEDARK